MKRMRRRRGVESDKTLRERPYEAFRIMRTARREMPVVRSMPSWFKITSMIAVGEDWIEISDSELDAGLERKQERRWRD